MSGREKDKMVDLDIVDLPLGRVYISSVAVSWIVSERASGLRTG